MTLNFSAIKHTLGVLLVKGANVKCVCGVHFSPWGDEGWRVFLLINLIPVHAAKEGVLFQLVGSAALATEPLIHISLEKSVIRCN